MQSHSQQNSANFLTASYHETPLGGMIALSNANHLYLLKFIDQNNLEKSIKQLEQTIHATIIDGTTNISSTLQNELTAYFNGTLENFSIPVLLQGTPFQQKSWQALTEISYGCSSNYKTQAIVVGNPKAYRAVANANKNNPIAIIIPCHRIIKSNGDLCGYNGGIHRKQAFLEVEKNRLFHKNLALAK